jgi:molybdopterin synthase sulfur carrier subunit
MIKVILPYHLQQLAGSGQMVELRLEGEATLSDALDELETRYPNLKGTIRDIQTHKRRDFIRFFACGRDISLEDPANPLPREVALGQEVLRIVGAMAGG